MTKITIREETTEEKEARITAKRAAEYPDIGDQLDAILKGFNQLRMQGTDLPADLDSIVAKWLQVKKDNPKGK